MFAPLTLLTTTAAVLALAGASTGAAHAAAPADSGLLAQYEPLMQFDPLEHFLPTKVESFITDADLEQQTEGVWSVVRKNAPPGDLPGVGSGTWRLDQDSCTPVAPLGVGGGERCWTCHQQFWHHGGVDPSDGPFRKQLKPTSSSPRRTS